MVLHVWQAVQHWKLDVSLNIMPYELLCYDLDGGASGCKTDDAKYHEETRVAGVHVAEQSPPTVLISIQERASATGFLLPAMYFME